MITILLVAVLGALISAVVGTIWYSPSTPMGKWHMQYLGLDKLSKEEQEELRKKMMPKMWKTYGSQLILSFFTAFFIAMVTRTSVQNGAPASSVFYYVPMAWLCFTVPMIGQNVLWGNCEGTLAWKKFFSESLSNLVTFLLIAFVATLFF